MSALVLDSPTERTVFESMSIEDQEGFLEGIRERRLASLKLYEELQAAKKAVRDEKLAAKAEKLIARIGKKLEAAQKAINDVEGLHREIRSMRILMESET